MFASQPPRNLKSPHALFFWSAQPRIKKADRFNSLRKKPKMFVGRSFSRDTMPLDFSGGFTPEDFSSFFLGLSRLAYLYARREADGRSTCGPLIAAAGAP